jgi:hypothetical protein
MRIMGVFAVLVLLSVLVFPISEDNNSKWCPLMIAIYQACSPELVMNYLFYTQTPKAPSAKRVSNVSPTIEATILTKEPEKETLSQLVSEPQPVGYRYTTYWNGVQWVHGRLFN